MGEQEHAPVSGGGELALQPRTLSLLALEPGVQHRRVDQHEAAFPVIEGAERCAEVALVEGDTVIADRRRRHCLEGLVADVVITGDIADLGIHVTEHRECRVRRSAVGRQRRHRMHHVSEMDDERGVQTIQERGNVTAAAIGERVYLPGRRQIALLGARMGVRDDGEGEERCVHVESPVRY